MKASSKFYLAFISGSIVFGYMNVALAQTNSGLQWATFTDAKRHFRFEYPSSWKTSTQAFSVSHYRDVFVSLSSFGKDHFALREQQLSSNTWALSPATITNQLPAGAVYLDIGWWEGPWPRFGPSIHEVEAADLSGLLKTTKDKTYDARLVTREVEFSKWGRHWSIAVYLHLPVSEDQRQSVKRILESFRFDGVPAGDPIWTIGEARRKLPSEADPDEFTREGGSSVYYTQTKQDGNDVLVTFTKHAEGEPKREWSFRVGEARKVTPISP
jgi:hypothetical protein